MQPTLRRSLYVVILLAGLAWILLSADKTNSATAGQIPAPQRGFLAPEFKLETSQGQSIALTDYRGKAVLVNLWATWCPPCRAEMPTIEKVYQEFQNQGLVVLGVNSTIQDDPAAIAPFVKQYDLTFPILLDVNGEASDLYEIRSLPTSFFIGRDGIIKEVVVGGPMSEGLLQAKVEEILK
ncbi:MAG TPA: TlpA disulfide reductase family protein [Anaerolineales bacterium]|nr:TlpA disulfide reductase family protein [Anaerolineales bacterium]